MPGFGVLAGPRPAHGLAPGLSRGADSRCRCPGSWAGAGRVSSSRLGLSVLLPVRTLPAAAELGVLWAGQLFLSGSSRGGAGHRDCMSGAGHLGVAAHSQLSAKSFAPSHTCSGGTWCPQVSRFGGSGDPLGWLSYHPTLNFPFTGKFKVGFLKLKMRICYYRYKWWKIRKHRGEKLKAGGSPTARKPRRLVPGRTPFRSFRLHVP